MGLAVTRRRVPDGVVPTVDSERTVIRNPYTNSLGTFCLELLLAMKRDKTNATSRRAIRTDNPIGIITSFLAAPMLHRIATPARIGRWQNIWMTLSPAACEQRCQEA